MIPQRHHYLLVVLTTEYDNLTVTVNHQLGTVVEVNLNVHCVEAEEDGLLGFCPLLDVDERGFALCGGGGLGVVGLGGGSTVEVLAEVLHQGDLL